MSALGEGSEPYSMDFDGDLRPFKAWLRANLTAEELVAYNAAKTSYLTASARWDRRLRWIGHHRGRLKVVWVACWRLRLEIRDLEARATERGGPKPRPSWPMRVTRSA